MIKITETSQIIENKDVKCMLDSWLDCLASFYSHTSINTDTNFHLAYLNSVCEELHKNGVEITPEIITKYILSHRR